MKKRTSHSQDGGGGRRKRRRKLTNDGAVEAKRLSALETLNGEKTLAERNVLGQYATPPRLASEMVALGLKTLRQSASKGPLRLLEPGFGSGVFTSHLVMQRQKAEIHVTGFEKDPLFARAFGSSFWPAAAADARVRVDVRNEDFTLAVPTGDEKYDVCICNPPYSRHHHLTTTEKQRMQAWASDTLGLQCSQLTGLHVYFTLLAGSWMRDGGVGVWLLPAEFFDVNYGVALKQYLLDHVTLLRMHRFDPETSQFDDALVSSIVLLVRYRKPSSSRSAIILSKGPSLLDPTVLQSLRRDQIHAREKWSPYFRNMDTTLAAPPSAPAARHPHTMGDFFTVKRGIATGCNAFFILNREQAQSKKLSPRHLIPLIPPPRNVSVSEIQADNENVWMFSSRLPVSDMSAPDRAFVEAGEARGIHKRYLCSKRSPWYAQTTREPPHFVFTYMGRVTPSKPCPFRFLLNASTATALNCYLLLYVKSFPASVKDDATSRLLFLRRLHVQLEDIGARTLIDGGRVYGGGMHKMEPRELLQLPVSEQFASLFA